jgi:hypothetical protein
MKEISLPISQTYSLTVDLQNLDISKAIDAGDGRLLVPLGTLSNEEFGKAVEVARQNGGKVLYASTSIEQKLEALLLEYFMGPFKGHSDRRVIFEREILQSSAFSYRTKKDLVAKLINELQLLSGKEKNALGSLLKKVMEWRNAFAHGRIQHEARTGCFIKYYSGEPRTLALTDEYWDEVEGAFKECDALLDQAKKKLGTVTD